MSLRTKLSRVDGRVLGAAMVPVVGLVAVALGQPAPGSGFNCVIQPTLQICKACSGCYVTEEPIVLHCGTIEATASFGQGLVAHCWIDVINGSPQYHEIGRAHV